MSFQIYTNIPAANNTPANDQPLMQSNFSNISGFLSVDHTMPGSTNAGTHAKVTLNTTFDASMITPTNPASLIYSTAGTADTNSQLFFKNQSGTFLLDCVKAFGVFSLVSSSPSFGNSYNCSSISGSDSDYTITLSSSSIVTGSNVIVFVNNALNTSANVSWSFSNPVLTIHAEGNFGNKISFIILQS